MRKLMQPSNGRQGSLWEVAVVGSVLGVFALAGAADARASEPDPSGAPLTQEAVRAPPGPALEVGAEAPRQKDKAHYETASLSVALKLGGAFSGVMNSMGASFSPELELGVILPPVDHLLEVFLTARWAAPSDEGDEPADARLPGDGVAHWKVTRNELAFGLGLRVRVPVGGSFRPYLAAGARLLLLRTTANGDVDGQSFGQNEELGTAFGGFGQLGAELDLGPGALLVELTASGAALDQTILADTNAGSLDAYLGYRFFF